MGISTLPTTFLINWETKIYARCHLQNLLLKFS